MIGQEIDPRDVPRGCGGGAENPFSPRTIA